MNVALIGSGNVATVLGRIISKKHKIVHVCSRQTENASILAKEFNCSFSGMERISDISADLFIISVSDSAIEETDFHLHDRFLVHTAGSVPMNVLKNITTRYGVLYPLQSLRKEMKYVPDIPFLIDANTSENLEMLKNFAGSVSNNIRQAGDEERLKLHAAAVIVSNFTNHLYALAEDFCNKENIDFTLLRPLIFETAQRIMNDSPSKVQTGPAVRKDIQTLDKHLRLLANYPKLRTTYMRLTDSIMHN